MTERQSFKEWIKNQPKHKRVAVLGAGPTIEQYSREYFKENYGLVIGCNWLYMDYDVDIAITTHYVVAEHVLQHEDAPLLIYSEKSSDAFYRDDNPHVKGVYFTIDEDLFTGNSIVITGAHLAAILGGEVHLYGVDLKKGQNGKHYYTSYRQMQKGIFPNGEYFPHWCNRVRWKMNGLSKVLNIPFIFH